jgi:tetratricopeptide (TPR) repeat protein
MKPAVKYAAWVLVLLLAALTCWRIVATGISDHLAREHPQQALEWDHNNPTALLALARQQIDLHELDSARETTLRLLEREPLAGQGFVLLGRIAEAQGSESQATLLSTIALRRAPHATSPLGWLIGQQLRQGRFAEALDSVDRMLRISPGRRQGLSNLLIELAGSPEFADALAEKLSERPAWRNQFVGSLIGKASADTAGQILSGVQRRGGLDAEEFGRWIDRLGLTGHWGEAYARWVGELDEAARNNLTGVYNGGFEAQPTGFGFDWRIGKATGVIVDRDAIAGAEGSYAIRLMFPGHRVETVPLTQWLLLSAGPYRLHFRANAQDLRGDRGMQWVIRCQGRGPELAASEALSGTFDWRENSLDFEVPEQGCEAQELSLRNAGSKGPGKFISGTIWFDDVAIDRIDRRR